MPLPPVPEFQKQPFKMKAIAWPGDLPNGYVSGELAAEACKNAGKRLCKEAEWVTACRGQQQTDFPYGNRYRNEGCNVFREDHPAAILHGSASSNHSDPRLNLVDSDGRALLRVTGGTPSCASKWGDDEIYDMVGNVDEWVDDPRAPSPAASTRAPPAPAATPASAPTPSTILTTPPASAAARTPRA